MEKKILVKEILEQSHETNKAKNLYKLGFCKEAVQMEKLDSGFVDLTFENGFKGFSVYKKDGVLFIAKPETEENNIYSYNVIELDVVSDEDYESLMKLHQNTHKGFFGVCRLVTLCIAAFGIVVSIIEVVTYILAYGGVIGIVSSSANIVTLGILIGIVALLYKKK